MTHEPGTGDIMTTMDPPFPGDTESPLGKVTLECPYGWQIVLQNGLDDSSYVHVQLVHPWHGVVTTGVYRR